jgi:membrane-associated HD superfamily phosphohydrolase
MVLLVLTWVNTLFSIVTAFFTLIFMRPSAQDLEQEKLEMAQSIVELKKLGMDSFVSLLERLQAMTEAMQPYFIQSNLVNIMVLACGAVAAWFMYRRNQLGFHLYIIYNLASVGSIYLFISPSLIPSVIILVNSLLSLVFVLLYAKHLPWLKHQG